MHIWKASVNCCGDYEGERWSTHWQLCKQRSPLPAHAHANSNHGTMHLLEQERVGLQPPLASKLLFLAGRTSKKGTGPRRLQPATRQNSLARPTAIPLSQDCQKPLHLALQSHPDICNIHLQHWLATHAQKQISPSIALCPGSPMKPEGPNPFSS